MAEKCEYHTLHEDTLKRHDHEIRDLDDRVTKNEKDIAVFDVELRNAIKEMAKLPKAIDGLTESNITLHNKVDCSSEKISKLEDDIREVKDNLQKIDEEGKVNVRKDLTSNYSKIKGIIYVACAIGGGVLAYLISLLINSIK